MVCLSNFAIFALSATALASPALNYRREVNAVSDATIGIRSLEARDFVKRQGPGGGPPPFGGPPKDDSQAVKDLEAEREKISPPLSQAFAAARAAFEDFLNSIPADQKSKVSDAEKALQDAHNAAKAAAPKDKQDKLTETHNAIDSAFLALPDDQRKALGDVNERIHIQRIKDGQGKPPGQ